MKPALLALAALLTTAGIARAQMPTEPVSLAGGRVVIGADVTATFAGADPGFFNYTDYEYNALRALRLGLTAQVALSRRVEVLGELRADRGDAFQPFALFVRIRPWANRRVFIHAGRIPPTFGAFARTTYGTSNLLIGTPLAYQYLTSLRTDALPATADDLLRMRGRGWLSSFPLGSTYADRGLPLVNSFRRDTGVQVHAVNGMIEWTGSVTTGSLSNPRVGDDNDGRQLAGRVVVRPAAPIAVGLSGARGAYLDRTLQSALPAGQRVEQGVQRAVGLDVEYSLGRFLTRAEMIRSRWMLPVSFGSGPTQPLDATSWLTEARYRLAPGLQVAGRVERLAFSSLPSAAGPRAWDAPVFRTEIGGSYAIVRNVIVKAAWQRNTRDGGRVREDSLGAVQVIYWF